ncbi:hypothetical protein like AT3G29635 [Hibiscus trionum]|uniref:Uncharacterized protein n=1 Tax=Hibiscus trionum TaxID=183268 RepID=A0A9W7MC22_HIBTR|nr:hypothetical protein like AT3G29635 [Hibiscus trionum]
MAFSSRVKILDTTRIKPSPEPPISAYQSSLPLTFCDTLWFKISPVERLFFYNLQDFTPADFISDVLPRLKQSLSLTLRHYLPVAGNLKWPANSPKPVVSYAPSDGVSLTVAESDADFDRLTSNGIYDAVELHPLVPQLTSSDDSASVIAVQITLFPTKGFSIGITAHHTVLDGKTTTMFMKSWAYLCKQGNAENALLPPELTPVFDRNVIYDTTGFDLDLVFLNQWLTLTAGDKSLKVSPNKAAAPSLVRATVTITREDLKKMRERVLSKSSENSKQLHLSPFVLTLGYVMSCLVKARGGDGDRTVPLAFAADCRPRLDPPVPENYFGNCNTGLGDFYKARDFMDLENGFAFAAEKVISVAGSPRFNLYGTDFGWGRPWKVVVVSIDENEAISMAESRDGSRGIEVGLSLKKNEMERFLSMFLKDV